MYLLESVLVTYSNSRKDKALIVVNLHVDIDRPVIVEHHSIHNLVANSTYTRNHGGYPHQSEMTFPNTIITC